MLITWCLYFLYHNYYNLILNLFLLYYNYVSVAVTYTFQTIGHLLPLLAVQTLPLLPVFSWCGSDDTADIVLPTYDVTEATLEMMGR